MTDKISVPFTAAQVDALNRFQRIERAHPFTCDGHAGGGDRTLVATRSGWMCCHCDYHQDWAHAVMVRIGEEMLFKEKYKAKYGG